MYATWYEQQGPADHVLQSGAMDIASEVQVPIRLTN